VAKLVAFDLGQQHPQRQRVLAGGSAAIAARA
jgi:hypothetical protein